MPNDIYIYYVLANVCTARAPQWHSVRSRIPRVRVHVHDNRYSVYYAQVTGASCQTIVYNNVIGTVYHNSYNDNNDSNNNDGDACNNEIDIIVLLIHVHVIHYIMHISTHTTL